MFKDIFAIVCTAGNNLSSTSSGLRWVSGMFESDKSLVALAILLRAHIEL